MGLSKQLVRFLLLTFLLYGGWLMVYELLIRPSGQLDHIITENISYFICLGLDTLGYIPHYQIAEKPGETFIFLAGNTFPVIRVGASCNGLELLVLFSIFIICYPGTLKRKVIFTGLGLLVIHILNITRNIILTVMAIHHSAYFEFFHRYIFIFMVYGAIFLMWLWWAKQPTVAHENR